jgi:FkbM family methyltransferase
MKIGQITSQLQLHRRLPLIRRPFWQRDQALAERDSALARLAETKSQMDATLHLLKEATEALNAKEEQANQVKAGLNGKPRGLYRPFALPPEFHAVSITGHEGVAFQIVVEGKDPPTYDRWVIDSKPYSDIARLLVQILSGGGTLIDLGANIGTICVPVAATGSRVIAVEMLPRNAMKLILAASLNRLDRFRIIQAAATDRDGLVWYAGDEAWAQISTRITASQATGVRLDTIVDQIELESPDFIQKPVAMKIDIEGHELAALRGAQRLFTEHRPIFVFESIQVATDHPEEAVALKKFVSLAGYELYMLRGTVLSPHLEDDLQISPTSDILAVPIEASAMIFRRLTNYSVRPLTRQEQSEWLEEVRISREALSDHVAAVKVALSLS